MNANDRGASRSRLSRSDAFSSWFNHHRLSARSGFLGILQKPWSFLMTTLVISIALALPALLYVMIDGAHRLAGGWDAAPRMTVYLRVNLADERAEALGKRLQLLQGVDSVEYVSRQAALETFRKQSGLGDVLDQLDENPLPPVYILSLPGASAADVESAAAAAKKIAGVDSVQTDLEWAGRLQHILLLMERLAFLLSVLLSLGVVLTTANTLRLEMGQRRQEIVVMKLVGATDAFVRRPLLYCGIWYGVAGAVMASAILLFVSAYLAGPIDSLVAAYGSTVGSNGAGTREILALLLIGPVLGLLGAWISVERHLRSINPV